MPVNKMFACFHFVVVLLIVGTLKDFTTGLRLVEVRIPNYVIKGASAQLECLYDLDGEALYSVKWYKDGNEFYRYVPRDNPPAQTFRLPGVAVDLHNSSDAIVNLHNVNLQSAGRFRCEVSGEAPSFQTVTEHGDMVVVSLPDQGPPKISGGRPRYQIGDWVRINCTAGRSKPAVNLSWFINSEPAEPQKLRKYDTIVSGREGLETSVLGLQFRVEQQHFRNGDMKLKCVASLSTFYWRSNEESVEGDRPQKAPVLESRESDSAFASNSRADPVQASNTEMARAPSALLLLALATAATLAGVTSVTSACCCCTTSSSWQRPARRHSSKARSIRDRSRSNDNNKVHDKVEEKQKQTLDKKGKPVGIVTVTFVELLSAARQKLKRFVRCSLLNVARQQQVVLSAR
ncbi:uncharacterized protein LOC133841542 isoform X2 [Drosophila sulfurigaster albostrigata]|uniref:uncharacterized protein LOC133841542 isoform X2 n=1 Tax=Drosophila sulfurigaster albostrigata TaxID=89887 RepID=UPI002D21BE38|nr:uncharacterized protein LOC133841542 isoform X2 [Drosophila sulfurigaster albostrigata]